MLYIEPNAGPAPIVQVIQAARHSVDLNVYYLSSRPILSALEAARQRGVQVRVILDGKPYGMKPRQVSHEFRAAEALGLQVRPAPSRFEATGGRYVYDHAKYVCNRRECAIGTANFDYSAFHYNREYIQVTSKPGQVAAARAVFAADWNNRAAGPAVRSALVLSPGATTQMVTIIDQGTPVDIESEELGNDSRILQAIARLGRQARVLLPASLSAADRRNVQWLRAQGVQVRLLSKRPIYLHAKMIVGLHSAFIGSENFSVSSLERNREMGLEIRNNNTLERLRHQFNQDWHAAAVSTPAYKTSTAGMVRNWYHRWKGSSS